LDPDLYSTLLYALPFFTALHVFFFVAEGTYLSLVDSDKKELKESGSSAATRVRKLLAESPAFFIAIKFALVISRVALIVIATLLALHFSRQLNLSFVVMSIAVLGILGCLHFFLLELWLKKLLVKQNKTIAAIVSFPLRIYYQLVRPIVLLLNRLLKLSRVLHIVEKSVLNPEAVISIVEEREKIVDLSESEKAMIHSIFVFGETEVHEIMVPRTDMVCIDENATLEEVTKVIDQKGHSRIPLYSAEGVDDITGILYAKDLIPYIREQKSEPIDLGNLARPAYFVPENKTLRQLLKEFQQNKYHMAIVVDEYGGTAGLVTLEDVIEEIVGDIQDEFDKELPLYRKLDENSFMVDAKIDLHELNDILALDLPTEGDYESLAGFILNLTGYVPEEKEKVEFGNYAFIIEKIDRNRIVKVKLLRHEIEETEEVNPDETNSE